MKRWTLLAAALVFVASAGALQAEEDTASVAAGMGLFSGDPDIVAQSVQHFAARGTPDGAAALILGMRFSFLGDGVYEQALAKITGETGIHKWPAWMLWQEKHPEIVPFDGFDRLTADFHALIDENFHLFLARGVSHEIRLEEVVWGGVVKDGIPALNNPKLIEADKADYLAGTDFVFGVKINGDARAYPLRILNWHEMFNDVVGGVPVALAYCTLCGSGILYETKLSQNEPALVFGSSGFLYRSNKLMYDQKTNSLWNQFTGRPVVGPLTGSGIELRTLPVVITSWENWRRLNPQSKVLDPDTGFTRDYAEGAAYAKYFASPDLMFPTSIDRDELKAKEFVFALRGAPAEKSWPLSRFAGGAVINDRVGVLALTLVGDSATRTVRAYQTDGQAFELASDADHVRLDGVDWQVSEDGLLGPDGQVFDRLPGHIAYWFAWAGYFGETGEVGLN